MKTQREFEQTARFAVVLGWIAICAYVVLCLTGCGGGGTDEPEATPVQQTEWRLEVLPWTNTYQGTIEVCPAIWIAPRYMAITASLDYAPNMTVYVNYRAVDSLPVAVHKGDAVYVCATMPAPLTIYSGSATIRVVWEP